MRSKAIPITFLTVKFLTILNLSIFFAAEAYTQSSINFDTVFIGNDENEADTTGYGAVSYDYYIGKYEVTNSEYAAFLNAVAATDTYSLWHQSMSIERTGLGGDYTYSVVDGKGEHPVVRVNFYDAARFTNWLMNGQPTGSQDQTTTENGFYTFSGASTISSQGTRSANKIDDKNWVAIASEDEWYKAAYYDRALNSGAGGYYKYPTGSDTAPIKSAPTVTPNSANYGGKNGVGATTVVGSYSGASSPYGTFDQGGNVQEWTDSIVDESKRAVRGGGYNASKGRALLSTFRYPTNSDIKQLNIGFRISSLSTMSVDAMLSAESGSYGIGDTLLIKAIWNDTVEVTGIPKLKLSNGSEAVYSNGSGTSTLLFSYTLQAGDVSAKDISVEEYTGTIKNASGDLVSQISGDLGSVEIDLKLPDYYVSTSGDDAGPGDFNNPWKTIQHAFETVESGYTVHIRGGKYHEAITANDLKGSSVSEITFTNYNEEEVIVAGTVQIPTADWSVHTGNIYKTTLTQDIWQLFVDSDMMTAARWPNVQQDWHEPDTSSGYNPTTDSYWDMDSTQARLTASSSWGHFYNDENYQSLSSLNKSIEGAMLVGYRTLVSGNHAYTEQITHHTAGSDNFMHTTLNFPADETASQPASKARYYIEADLDLLDSPGEWFFDKDTRELYVWFKDSGSPEGRHIEGKNKDYILKLKKCENLIFKGIQFFAGAFKLDDTYDTIFEDCKFIHSSYGKRMLKVIKPGDGFVRSPFAASCNGTYGSRSPANLTWRNCEFAKYEGAGLHIRTNGGQLVENCYFHNGQIVQVVYGAVSDHKGSGTIIRRNTFHTLGEGNATKNGKDGLLEYNRVYNMHFDNDSSAFQTPVGAQHSTRHRYNWIHDSHGRNAVRFDGDPAGIRCKIDHVVAMHNMRGFRLKGDQHQIYNLTALGNTPKPDITIGIEKFYGYEPADCMEFECRIKGRRGTHPYHANENSIVKNIAANSINTWPLIPVDNAAIWHGNDLSQDLTDQLRDPANFDFRPKATSDLVDKGVVIPGFTDVYEGVAPDIGAYEYGDTNYWIPGCKFNKASTPIPPDNTNTAKTDADLMWLEGKNALEHRVYFGTQSGNLPLLSSQTNNIFDPGFLDENTEYFWRIDTITVNGIITGDEWSFTCKKAKPKTLTSTFYPTEDTYVDSAKPDMNFGDSEFLQLRTPITGTIIREAYIKFRPQVEGDIVAATLRFHANTLSGGVNIYPVADNSWQEDTMTWNPPNSPPLMGDLPIATKPDSNDGWYEADVSTYFSENGLKAIGLVRGPKESSRSIQSSESATPPELIIEYIIPTSQTNHSPYFHADTFGSTEATANVKYSADISAEATDPDLDQVIFSKAAGPSWLIVNPDGTLSGTPLPTDVGTNSFTLRVTDPSEEFNDGLMSIKVLPVSDVVDTTAPVITLNGDVVVTVEAGTNYSDAGAGAVDGYDGDLTGSMEVTDGVDILTVGSYTVSYNVSDAAGNAAVPVIRTVIVVDTTPPVIALVGEAIVTVEAGSIYEDAGAVANDTGDGDLSSKIEVSSTVNTDKLGEYTVTYTVSDSSGNEAVEVNRVVIVVDTTAPVITLNGDVVVTVEAGTNYSDAGAGAVDGYDGDLTGSMEVTDGVDILTVGSYTVSYNVSDAAGNAAVPVIRTVIVVDTTPPVIALVGEAIVTVEAGSIYEDAGAVANDTGDGDLSSKIEVSSTVNTDKLGEYTVTYTVSDSSGNEAVEVNRVVIVVDTTAPVITLNGDVVVTVEAGTNYSDAGAGAVDGYDGDLTGSMEVTDGVDILWAVTR